MELSSTPKAPVSIEPFSPVALLMKFNAEPGLLISAISPHKNYFSKVSFLYKENFILHEPPLIVNMELSVVFIITTVEM